MARKAHFTEAPSAAQAWTQARAVKANRSFERRKAVREAVATELNPPSLASALAQARPAFVDRETDIWQMPTSGNDPLYGGDTQGQFDDAVEAFEIADQYFAYDDEGYEVKNLAEDYGAQVITPTTYSGDTSPAPLTIVPTNTINPDRPRTVAAGYDKTRQVLTVVFRDGTFYNYYNVDYREWQAFRMSRSKGRYILAHLNIKDRGYADAQAVPVTVRAALYNVMRVGQIVAPNERWQQPDLARIHNSRQARQSRQR